MICMKKNPFILLWIGKMVMNLRKESTEVLRNFFQDPYQNASRPESSGSAIMQRRIMFQHFFL